MALIWKKERGNTRYEVRSAGNTRRLYTNGVFHSQYNPVKPLSGGIWDLLMLPVFFHPLENTRRILVLGVGGGTVIRQLRRYSQVDSITGVELNPIHLQVARRFFGVNKNMATLYQADAIAWLKQYQGPPFDLIIEDLFGEEQGEPVRAIPASANWFRLLTRHLSQHGSLVMNFTERSELSGCGYFQQPAINKKFQSAFQLSLPMYENIIAVFLRQHVESKMLRQRLSTCSKLSRVFSQLPYRIRRL